MRRNWIKIYVDQCLRGTMMDEMKDPGERFLWFAFLLLAGDSPYEGKIALTEDMGYSDEQLGSMLKCDPILIKRAKKIMVKYDKIKVLNNNIIQIVNWKKYQSEYQRQKIYRGDKKEGVTTESDNPKLQVKVTPKGDEQEGDRDRDKKEIRKEKDIKNTYMSTSFKNDVIFKWNGLAQKYNLPAIKEIKSGSLREKNLRARNAEKEFDFELLIDMVENSPFLLGKTKHAFFVFFDWIIKPTNYQKIIEGNYLDRQSYHRFSGIVEGIKSLERKYSDSGGANSEREEKKNGA